MWKNIYILWYTITNSQLQKTSNNNKCHPQSKIKHDKIKYSLINIVYYEQTISLRKNPSSKRLQEIDIKIIISWKLLQIRVIDEALDT